MIRLMKGPVPTVLKRKGLQWTQEYLMALSSGTLTATQRYRYRDPEIKQSIKKETCKKCAYCEGKVSHGHPGEADHILPVLHRPELVFEWTNLTYVCTECNRRKSSYYSETEPLVNPYRDEPSDHLMFFGPLVLHRDDKGYRTSRKLDLSRLDLLERKQERIESLNFLIQKWRECSNENTRKFLKEEILQYASTSSEFSATLKSFIVTALGWRI